MAVWDVYSTLGPTGYRTKSITFLFSKAMFNNFGVTVRVLMQVLFCESNNSRENLGLWMSKMDANPCNHCIHLFIGHEPFSVIWASWTLSWPGWPTSHHPLKQNRGRWAYSDLGEIALDNCQWWGVSWFGLVVGNLVLDLQLTILNFPPEERFD